MVDSAFVHVLVWVSLFMFVSCTLHLILRVPRWTALWYMAVIVTSNCIGLRGLGSGG